MTRHEMRRNQNGADERPTAKGGRNYLRKTVRNTCPEGTEPVSYDVCVGCTPYATDISCAGLGAQYRLGHLDYDIGITLIVVAISAYSFE